VRAVNGAATADRVIHRYRGNKRYEDNDLRASSWAWAALDRAVRFRSYFREDLDIAVISASTDLKGDDQYGKSALAWSLFVATLNLCLTTLLNGKR